MKKIKKFEKVMNSVATVIASTAFSVMVLLISINVFTRYLLSTSLNWAEEVAYLCFNWAVFFGVAIVYRYQGLTAIDLIVDRLHGKVKKAVLIFGYTLIVLVNIGLIVWGTQFSVIAWARKSPSLQIPYFFYDISIPLAGLMLLYYSIKFLIRTIRNEDVSSAALEDRA